MNAPTPAATKTPAPAAPKTTKLDPACFNHQSLPNKLMVAVCGAKGVGIAFTSSLDPKHAASCPTCLKVLAHWKAKEDDAKASEKPSEKADSKTKQADASFAKDIGLTGAFANLRANAEKEPSPELLKAASAEVKALNARIEAEGPREMPEATKTHPEAKKKTRAEVLDLGEGTLEDRLDAALNPKTSKKSSKSPKAFRPCPPSRASWGHWGPWRDGAPKQKHTPKAPAKLAEPDDRLPPAGTTLTKTNRDGKSASCKVTSAGVEYKGESFKTLSGAARAAAKDMGLGASQNGFVFWGIVKPAARVEAPLVAIEKACERFRSTVNTVAATKPDAKVADKLSEMLNDLAVWTSHALDRF